MTEAEKRAYIVATVAVIIALLLWRYRVSNVNIDKRTQTPGALVVAPNYSDYQVAPLQGVGTDFDWMNTTDLACDCDESFNPAPWVSPDPVVVLLPQYSYAERVEYLPSTPINPTFTVYQAPPPPSWWYEQGYNVHHERALFLYTETGVNGITGKYSRSAWHDPQGRPAYPQQTKNVVRQADGSAIIDGKRFMHDPSRDKYMPPEVTIPAMSWGTG